jgi:hypothetical protein
MRGTAATVRRDLWPELSGVRLGPERDDREAVALLALGVDASVVA